MSTDYAQGPAYVDPLSYIYIYIYIYNTHGYISVRRVCKHVLVAR